MAIKMSGPGDLTGTSKKEKKDRLASFSKRQNERVATSLEQQSNGFKGESLNDHGLPDGHVQVDRAKSSTEPQPKFRVSRRKPDGEYADGTKGITLKPKTSIDSDATKVKAPMNIKKPSEDYASKLSKMKDNDILEDSILKDHQGLKYRSSQAIDTLASRNIKRRGGYAKGTKGIKISKANYDAPKYSKERLAAKNSPNKLMK